MAMPLPVHKFGKLSLSDAAGDKVLALAQDWSGGAYEGKLEALAGCL
jgi:hypothetical protein